MQQSPEPLSSVIGHVEQTPASLESESPVSNGSGPPLLLCWPRAVLRFLSAIVGTFPPGSPDAEIKKTAQDKQAEARVLGSTFLISLFSLDAFSWGTGKIFQYEVLLMADDPEVKWCYVIVQLVMTASEAFTEFVASAVTPRIFACTHSSGPMTSKQLVHFALKVYAFSNWSALLVYPCFGILVHGLGFLNPGMIYALAVVRTTQYAFCNQVGDASIEMAKPHWMLTFEGVQLRFPGCCPCFCQISRLATSKTLALYLAIMRYMTFGLIALIYTGVRKSTVLRWSLAGVLLIWNALAPLPLLNNFKHIAAGIGEERTEEQTRAGRNRLRWDELSFLAFVVVAKGVPPQASEALQSIMVIELSSKLQMGMIAIAFFGIMLSLIYKIVRESGTGASESSVLESQSKQSKLGSCFFWDWILPLAVISISLAGGATCITIGTTVIIYVALVIWIPILPLSQVLKAAIDTFLLRYDEQRSTNLVYWENVLVVVVNAPLLAVNWVAVEAVNCDDEDGAEEKAAGILLYVTAGIMLLAALYYSTVDYCLASGSLSLRELVDTAASAAEEQEDKVEHTSNA